MSLARLVAVASHAIDAAPPDVQALANDFGSRVADELAPLLQMRNGFYAFSDALHVFPDAGSSYPTGIRKWNDFHLWRRSYGMLAMHGTCFAEDIFGNQFSFCNDGIHKFDAERGGREPIAASLDEWAGMILEEPSLWTGSRLAEAWCEVHGPLERGYRLAPRVPFVHGGEYSVENLQAREAVYAMRERGVFAQQLRSRRVPGARNGGER